MEIKISEGRYTAAKYGDFEYVSGIDEIRQRVEMKLSTKKGSFLPLPQYGSRLYQLSSIKPSKRESAARQFVCQALADEKNIDLLSLKIIYEDREKAMLELVFQYKGESSFEIFTRI